MSFPSIEYSADHQYVGNSSQGSEKHLCADQTTQNHLEFVAYVSWSSKLLYTQSRQLEGYQRCLHHQQQQHLQTQIYQWFEIAH